MTEIGEGQPQSPAQRGALAAWDRLRGDGAMPRREAFSPAAFGPWLGSVIWFEVEHEPFDLLYRVMGDSIRERVKRNVVGLRMSTLAHQAPGSVIWSQYREVAATGTPLQAWLPYEGGDILVERVNHLLLPWGEAGRVTNILTVCAFYSRSFDPDG
jgi:hypothetical protein